MKSFSLSSYTGGNIWKAYFYITKPGIIGGNLIAAFGGFMLGTQGSIQPGALFGVLVGMAFSIASGCVLNNYIDRDIDSKMERTQQRTAIVKLIPAKNALLYAFILAVIGVSTLALFTNWLVLAAAALGFVFYIGIYTYTKRHSILGVHMGAVSGAVPLVSGYLAATNHFDLGALLLFFILFLWQMPHFYAISIFRMEDYKKAHIPALPIKRGIAETKLHIITYIILFILACLSLTLFQFTKYAYAAGMLTVGILWLLRALQGFKTHDDIRWARKVFGLSLLNLLVFNLLISLAVILP
ncbi:MAG: heme o synthase [Candidatus Levyibacteriota bacterium]